MAARLYYVNHEEKTALFCGEYNSEPDLSKHPALQSWLDAFGPARAYYIRSDVPPVYPWSNGNGKIDGAWKLWIHYPGKHNMKPSGPWMAWPTRDVKVLAMIPGIMTRAKGR